MIRATGAAAGETLYALAAALPRAAGKAVEAEALALRNEAKRRCPANDGALRESISAVVNVSGEGADAVVGSALPYAANVELGTLQTPPAPYLAPALDARRQAIAGHIQQAVRDALEGK